MGGKSDASPWNSDESRKVKRLMGFYEFEVFRGKSAFYADVPRVRRCTKMPHWFLSVKSRLPWTATKKAERETEEYREIGKQVRILTQRWQK